MVGEGVLRVVFASIRGHDHGNGQVIFRRNVNVEEGSFLHGCVVVKVASFCVTRR